MHVGALLLAAGFSNRFGGIKLLARLNNGSTVFAQTLNRLSAAVEEVVIITRPDLVSALEADESQIQPFDHADQGMGASLAFGMKFTKHWDACIVCLSDMPFVRSATYSLLIESADKDRIVIPEFNGTRGNPVVFGCKYFDSLAELDGDSGGKSLLARYPQDLMPIEVTDPAILTDIDTQADLANLQSL
ncbi:MAG: nucleotidyltransferase family protein [Pseudomonadota bacterium]|nr:nucleotidyltransferase family protein [Pseudomonadota bacterium]MEC8453495.1 nucleotidyltransferase family protein [Pseudomonadota bacterium]MEE3010894.1 nucleotidyltransferase family protein [Pseudomonadota bacterium]